MDEERRLKLEEIQDRMNKSVDKHLEICHKISKGEKFLNQTGKIDEKTGKKRKYLNPITKQPVLRKEHDKIIREIKRYERKTL